MKIIVFVPSTNQMHITALNSFYNGLMASGEKDIMLAPIETYKTGCCDVAVIFGIGKKDVPISYPRKHVMQGQRASGGVTVVVERGYIKRDRYYAVGLNGLNGRANFNNLFVPSDRFQNLDVEMKEWRDKGDHIIVAGQVPSDASVQNVDIINWCVTVINILKEITDREIIFRPHPLAPMNKFFSILGAKTSIRRLEDDFENSHAVVCYNSNIGVDAVLNGVPVFAFDIGSMVWDIANKSLADIENPVMYERDEWANRIAYAQWNLDEISNGLAWLHIKSAVNLYLNDDKRMVQ